MMAATRLGYLFDGKDTGRVNQGAIIRFVRDYWLSHGYGPDLRTVTKALGLSSTSVAAYHVAILVREGVLESEPRQARTLRPANWWTYLSKM